MEERGRAVTEGLATLGGRDSLGDVGVGRFVEDVSTTGGLGFGGRPRFLFGGCCGVVAGWVSTGVGNAAGTCGG